MRGEGMADLIWRATDQAEDVLPTVFRKALVRAQAG